MDNPVTEKLYPVQLVFVFKSTFITFILLLFLFFLNLYDSPEDTWFYYLLTPAAVVSIIVYDLLQRVFFHYSLENKFLIVKQGVLRKQEKHIPYGVIQNLIIKRDILDRLFGLSSLVIENAAVGAGSQLELKKIFGLMLKSRKRDPYELIGVSGNKISIPGLKKDHAEILKSIVLQKMKENPIDDNQSGL